MLKKHIRLLPLLAVLLVGCNKPNLDKPASVSEATPALSKTPGLEGCSLFTFQEFQGDLYPLKVIRCDAQATTTTNRTFTSGKSTYRQTTVLIDGVTYVRQ